MSFREAKHLSTNRTSIGYIYHVGHIKEYPRENVKTYADPRVIFIQVTLLCVQSEGCLIKQRDLLPRNLLSPKLPVMFCGKSLMCLNVDADMPQC